MPTWPSSGAFPQSPLPRTWMRRPINIMVEFKPDLGPARKRRLTTGTAYLCSGTFPLVLGQFDQLMSFYRNDCVYGSLPFTWIDPEDRVTVRTWEFKEVPALQHITARYYEASVSLIRQS